MPKSHGFNSSFGPTSRLLLTALAVFAFTFAAHADTISAGAVATINILPSADSLAFSASSQTISIPGTFTQSGVFNVGDSGSLTATIPITFTDVITVNGMTQSLVFTGQDVVTLSIDTLTINALGPITFGNVSLSFHSFTTDGTVDTSPTVILTANVTSTAPVPEPSTLAMFGIGMLGVARLIGRRLLA